MSHLTLPEVAERLGVTVSEARAAEQMLRYGDRISARNAIGLTKPAFESRMRRIQEQLRLHGDVHVCVVFERVRRGATTAEAMEGIERC